MKSKEISEKIIEMTTKVGSGKTICPSGVARKLSPDDWRDLMSDVREVACELHRASLIEITQKGMVVKDFDFKGPIRLRMIKS